ncbi:MAG: non-homologous end-joining DNA ligase [Nitriliruptorales bacterium]
MLARLTDERFDDPDWIFEPKLDGIRVIAVRDGDDVLLASRTEKSMNATYPELVDAVAGLAPDRLVFDGEIVAFSGDRTSFERLQGRMGIQDPTKALRTGIAIYCYAFDLLHVDGHDLTRLPLRTRKSILRDAVEFTDPLRFSTHRNGDGREFFDAACSKGWEGLIAKRASSTYRPGSRSRDWQKWKCIREQEVVVGGFTEPKGSRVGFGALLVGYYEDGELRYAGKVGTGWDDATLQRMRERLDGLEREESPFADPVKEKGAHWVAPELVAEVAFTEWTEDLKLRHPRYLGLRDDKEPEDVVREVPG